MARTRLARPRGLLFDLDEVLVDARAARRRAWTWWCGEYGLNPAPFLGAHGRTGKDMIARLAPSRLGLDSEAEAARVTDYETADTEGVVARRGAADALALGLPSAIVTSARRRLAEARLAAAGLGRPRVLIAAESVTHGKPHPEPYASGAAALGLAVGECHALDDAPEGIQSARAAGATVIGVLTTHGASELAGAHYLVADVAAYLELIGVRVAGELVTGRGNGKWDAGQ